MYDVSKKFPLWGTQKNTINLKTVMERKPRWQAEHIALIYHDPLSFLGLIIKNETKSC